MIVFAIISSAVFMTVRTPLVVIVIFTCYTTKRLCILLFDKYLTADGAGYRILDLGVFVALVLGFHRLAFSGFI